MVFVLVYSKLLGGLGKGFLFLYFFLFMIMVKALSVLLYKDKDCELWEGFEVGKGKEVIIHIQFVDDTFFFYLHRWEEDVVLKRVLSCFGLTFGLKINLSKSLLVGVGSFEEEI